MSDFAAGWSEFDVPSPDARKGLPPQSLFGEYWKPPPLIARRVSPRAGNPPATDGYIRAIGDRYRLRGPLSQGKQQRQFIKATWTQTEGFNQSQSPEYAAETLMEQPPASTEVITLTIPAGALYSPPYDVTPDAPDTPHTNVSDYLKVVRLLPVEVKVVNRDDPTKNWDTGPVTSGPAFTSPTISEVSDVKNGDLISWKIPGLTGGTFQWWAAGPNGSRKDAPTSVTTSEWKLEDPLDWLPGNWRIHCRYTPSGGAATEFDFEQKIGYRSADITVLGWIDGTKIDLPAQYAALVPQTVNGVGAHPIGDIMDSFTMRGSFLYHIGTGFPYTIPLTPDGARQYVNAYLIKNSPNNVPPATFTTTWSGYPGRRMVDDQALTDFYGETDKYRSFHRFQVRFELENNGTIKGQPTYIKRMTAVGVTPVDWLPDPTGETGPHDKEVNTTGAVVQFNPKNGKQHSASLANDFEQYTQGRISTSGTLSGGSVSKNLNNLKVPWIWSIIEFDAQHARSGSTPIHEHEIFPVYHLYYNGVRLDQHSNTISRAIMEQFIQLGDNP
jgi:hypothetical protein